MQAGISRILAMLLPFIAYLLLLLTVFQHVKPTVWLASMVDVIYRANNAMVSTIVEITQTKSTAVCVINLSIAKKITRLAISNEDEMSINGLDVTLWCGAWAVKSRYLGKKITNKNFDCFISALLQAFCRWPTISLLPQWLERFILMNLNAGADVDVMWIKCEMW
jgi:hypothetical protein